MATGMVWGFNFFFLHLFCGDKQCCDALHNAEITQVKRGKPLPWGYMYQ